ncbi:membrane-targeted effector domain-containing toxin [Pseudomonas yamanorum]|uniref:membrane-targeted effector domain-containing toxin n=1 Tax=Pseudomonas yamanorum TaxID=515393 RepID=UPI003B9FA7F4
MTSIVRNSVLSSIPYPSPPPPPIPFPVIPSYPDETLQSATDVDDPAADTPPPDGPKVLKTALADRKNQQTLAQQLTDVATLIGPNASFLAVQSALRSRLMDLAPDSSYTPHSANAVSLANFLKANGLPEPTTHDELLTLASKSQARSHPHPLGNLGGALSWPLPLNTGQQNELLTAAREHAGSFQQANQQQGLLEFLSSSLPLSAEVSSDPVKALEALIGSPRGQALGEALQSKLESISTDSSVNDHVLAAINLALDHESITQPHRNKVAGFDLSQKRYWGKPASAIVAGLRKHLTDTGKTSPANASLGTHLLLMRAAPQLLIKDIPDSVVYGSQAWANLCIAAAAIEAKAPGSVANMSFAEVMVAADSSGPAPEAAQTAALLDWAVVNGVLEAKDDTLYEKSDIDTAMDAFNYQLDKLKIASGLLDAPLPSRKQMALDLLKEKFGESVPFEEKVLLKPNKTANKTIPPRGPYSMLDLTMQGEKITASDWALKPETQGVDLHAFAAFTQGPGSTVPDLFDTAISQTIKDYKTVKKYSILNALANLPPEDKENLRLGKLNFYKEKSYRVSWIPFAGETLFHTSKKILVTTNRQNKPFTYEFDTEKGTIKKVSNSIITRQDQKIANEVTRIEEFSTFDSKRDYIKQENPLEGFNPNLFKNFRADYLADSIVEGLDLDAIRHQAAGTTPDEHRRAVADTIGNFFLDLIPLRSAIVNFSNGNYRDGFSDLAFDALGFLTAGAGVAAKVGKTLSTVSSAASKAVKLSKIFGVTALSELNPLSGLGDLAVGAGKLAINGASAATQGLKTLKGTFNNTSLVAAGNQYAAVAAVTHNVAEQTVEGSAVMRNGKWYAFDADRMQPYGPPLDTFDTIHTLMPPSPDIRQTGHRIPSRSAHRHNPLNRSARPAADHTITLKTDHLPTEEYVKHIKGAPSDAHFTPSRRQATKDRFEEEMNVYYQRMANGGMPGRPIIPAVASYEKVPDLLGKSLDAADVVVLGENHLSLASFRTLNDNMQLFKQKGVKVIGIEGMFYDNNRRILDDGMGKVGPHDRPHDPDITLEKLIKKFQANGIEVVPLDHPYLTRHKHERNYYTSQNIQERNIQRLQEFNYYAANMLQQHSGKGKVIALMGRNHINTTQNIPGVAELTGGIGIGIYERTGMRVGYGTNSLDPRPGPSGALTSHNDITGDLQIFALE